MSHGLIDFSKETIKSLGNSGFVKPNSYGFPKMAAARERIEYLRWSYKVRLRSNFPRSEGRLGKSIS